MAATPRKLRLCKGSQIFLRGKKFGYKQASNHRLLKRKKEKKKKKSAAHARAWG